MSKLQHNHVPSFISNQKEKHSSYGWQWCQDGGEFEFYPDAISRKIEEHYSKYQSQKENSIVSIETTRYNDYSSQSYEIDFENLIQKNRKTGFVRKIRRRRYNIPQPHHVEWQCELESGWRPYESLAQNTIEDAFQRYLKKGDSRLTGLQFPGRPECYSIDFKENQQINQVFGTKRRVRRVFLTPSLKNSRLSKLLDSSIQLSSPQSRDQGILVLVHMIIWNTNGIVYGGFVRDWIVRNEECNDIDVLLPESTEPCRKEMKRQLESLGKKFKLKVQNIKDKGAAFTMIFKGEWRGKSIEVDLVKPNVKQTPPYVDCDVDNLSISRAKGFSKLKPQAGGRHLDLDQCVRHCQNKEFVYLYDLGMNHDMNRRRLDKLFSKGWMCLSPLPRNVRKELSAYQSLMKPKEEYRKEWWKDLS
eukprot:gb/GECH01013466.1/.p1 GENE.gb/GECH01013466.1/~~gb/GECH01013466.1/.p1  ORF type:complete len:416 (+),score=97.76 gb/GECH01013466.1/:1-1248(+)